MIDFASVQWARRVSGEIEALSVRSAEELQKIGRLLTELSKLKAADATPTAAQMTVLLQNLHTKNLESLEAIRGGNLMVHFTGGGYEYERFLLRADGRVPNHKYESQKAK